MGEPWRTPIVDVINVDPRMLVELLYIEMRALIIVAHTHTHTHTHTIRSATVSKLKLD